MHQRKLIWTDIRTVCWNDLLSLPTLQWKTSGPSRWYLARTEGLECILLDRFWMWVLWVIFSLVFLWHHSMDLTETIWNQNNMNITYHSSLDNNENVKFMIRMHSECDSGTSLLETSEFASAVAAGRGRRWRIRRMSRMWKWQDLDRELIWSEKNMSVSKMKPRLWAEELTGMVSLLRDYLIII